MSCRKKKYATADAADKARVQLEAKTNKFFKIYMCDFHKAFHLAVKDYGRTGKCPSHPEEEIHIVIKSGVSYLTCPECEWNPPNIPSLTDTGCTSPDIKTMGKDWD